MRILIAFFLSFIAFACSDAHAFQTPPVYTYSFLPATPNETLWLEIQKDSNGEVVGGNTTTTSTLSVSDFHSDSLLQSDHDEWLSVISEFYSALAGAYQTTFIADARNWFPVTMVQSAELVTSANCQVIYPEGGSHFGWCNAQSVATYEVRGTPVTGETLIAHGTIVLSRVIGGVENSGTPWGENTHARAYIEDLVDLRIYYDRELLEEMVEGTYSVVNDDGSVTTTSLFIPYANGITINCSNYTSKGAMHEIGAESTACNDGLYGGKVDNSASFFSSSTVSLRVDAWYP